MKRAEGPLAAALALVLVSASVNVYAQGPAAPGPSGAPSAPPPAAPAVRPLAESLTGVAKGDYVAGRVLFQDGDFSSAMVKFASAYEASKDARLLWNMAACEKGLRHYAKVLALLERYGREAAPLLTPDDKRELDELVALLQPLVSRLTLVVTPPGAAIRVDDVEVGRAPLAKPLVVDLGSRKIEVKKPGFKDFRDVVFVKGAGELSVNVALERDVHEGTLVVIAGPGDVIAVDGKSSATGRFEGRLASGPHTVRVSGAGMRAHVRDVVVADGQTRTVDVALEPEAKGGIPAWLWLGAGALVVSGLAVGGYFLLRPADKDPPPPVQGTAPPGAILLP